MNVQQNGARCGEDKDRPLWAALRASGQDAQVRALPPTATSHVAILAEPSPAPRPGHRHAIYSTGTLQPSSSFSCVPSFYKEVFPAKRIHFNTLPAVWWGWITLLFCHQEVIICQALWRVLVSLLLSSGLTSKTDPYCTFKITTCVIPAKDSAHFTSRCLCQRECVCLSSVSIITDLWMLTDNFFLIRYISIVFSTNRWQYKLKIFFQGKNKPHCSRTCILFNSSVSRDAASSKAKASIRHKILNAF